MAPTPALSRRPACTSRRCLLQWPRRFQHRDQISLTLAGRQRRAGWPRFCCSLAEPRQQVVWEAEPFHPGTPLLRNRTVDRALGARKMWRLVFVFCLLLSSIAFAGESRGRLQVGITITGNGNASRVNPTPATIATSDTQVSVPLPTERPAANGPSDSAPSTR